MELQPYKQGLEQTKQESPVTAIMTVLEAKRDTAVQNRAEVESRWLRDLQQFEGNTLDRMTKGDTDYRSAVRKAPPVVHLTRTRTLSIAARIINMLVPSNERSWDIQPTPVPSMLKMVDDDTPVMDPSTGQMAMVPDTPDGQPEEQGPASQPTEQQSPAPMEQPPMDPGYGPGAPVDPMGEGMPMGVDSGPMPGDGVWVGDGQPGMEQPPEQPMRPVTKGDLVKEELREADKKSDRMRQHMDDQLTECRYNAEQRKSILDGCKLGTGIIEGPVVAGSYKKARKQLADGQWVSHMEENSVPEYRCVDPWNFYPIPAEHITKCEGVFIDNMMNRREIQELKLLPGFDTEMIDEVLREKPEHSNKYTNSMVERANITGETMPTDTRYSIWKFTGSLDREEMEQLGLNVDEDLDVIDPIIEAWFCNTRLLKIKRHPLEGGYRLPYYVWNYEESETTMFGYGVPYFMRDSDRVIQSTWHMILHNAAISAGPMLVRHKGTIEPADGTEEIAGGLKQWYFTDPDATIKDAFQVFNIDARIDELTAVHQQARQNADEELAFPLLAQGEPTEAVPTSSGLAMLMNASNVVQRRIAQSYDDEVLEPSISGLYDYNMIYLEDADAKGDMTIKPLGSSKLVVKDMQAQQILAIADITTNDRFAPLMKDDELLRAILKSAEMDHDTYMKTEDELAGQGPSPMEEADLERIQAETDKVRAEAEEIRANLGAPPESGGASQAEYAEIQFKYDRMQTDLQIQQMKLEGSALEAAKAENIKLADIDSKFQLGVRADETKRLVAQLEDRRKQATEGYMTGLKAEELRMKKQNLSMNFDTF